MLLNLSNHPSSQWQPEQLREASENYGSLTDLMFPQVDPAGDEEYIRQLAEDYCRKCLEMFPEYPAEKQDAVHIMGELTFCLTIVAMLQQKGVVCVASTSGRFARIGPAGEKISAFSFVRFRKYPVITSVPE